jgi:amino-acid N-acetyltransferase
MADTVHSLKKTRGSNKPKDLSEVEGKTTQRAITYSFADPDDKGQIRRLLSQCELPTLYVHRHLKSFMVARADKKIIGVIGIEVYGRTGLFRSLCVDEAYRGRGIAKVLNKKLLTYARMWKIDRLYLFTWYAEKFASKLGFRRIDKRRIPKGIRSTWQFRKSHSYPSHVCMMKEINRSAQTRNT